MIDYQIEKNKVTKVYRNYESTVHTNTPQDAFSGKELTQVIYDMEIIKDELTTTQKDFLKLLKQKKAKKVKV